MNISRIILSAATIVACTTAFGRPAHTHTTKFAQPDGTEISLRLIGDERSSLTVTADSHEFPLVRRGNTYFYATVSPSGQLESTGIQAMPYSRLTPELRQALETSLTDRPLYTLSASSQSRIGTLTDNVTVPCRGNIKCLAVLVNYTDVAFTVDSPKDYYTQILNSEDITSVAAEGQGSVKAYFQKQSYGAFTPEFDVYGPLTLNHDRAYYGTNNYYGSDQAAHEMALEAAAQLHQQGVDLSQYDNDGDGEVDNILVIYAGETAALAGNPEEYVWPHSWNISYGGVSRKDRTFGSVVVDHYICANETVKNEMDGIGTIVHEFSHALGLPDLYSTDSYDSHYNTPCWWSVMDIGCDLGNGWTPPLYSTYERFALGWVEPMEMNDKKYYLITSLADDGRPLMVSDPDNENEKYFFEYRTLTGWDRNIPAAGILIWRMRYDEATFSNNAVNNNASRMLVDLIEAKRPADITSDNVKDFNAFIYDPWPQTGATSFTLTTTPSFSNDSGKGFYHADGTENRIVNIATGINGKAGLGAYATANRPANHLDVGKHQTFGSINSMSHNMPQTEYTLSGHTLTLRSSPSAQAIICTPSGATVATAALTPNHDIQLTLPSSGIYLLRVADTTAKLLVR